jgi:transposase-like protein
LILQRPTKILEEHKPMTALESIDAVGWLGQQAEQGDTDVLRAMVAAFANAVMSAEADAACGADYGQRSEDRTNRRNGYRLREWDTRAGTVELAIPKLRQGSYFPDWLLEHRRRAEQALVTVVATSYLLGVSTRRVEKLAEQLGVTRLSKSQVSEMAAHRRRSWEWPVLRGVTRVHASRLALDGDGWLWMVLDGLGKRHGMAE